MALNAKWPGLNVKIYVFVSLILSGSLRFNFHFGIIFPSTLLTLQIIFQKKCPRPFPK